MALLDVVNELLVDPQLPYNFFSAELTDTLRELVDVGAWVAVRASLFELPPL